MAFTTLKQSKLARVVHHSELLQQGLNDLTGPCAGADVQVFGRVLRQVEGGTAFHPTSLPASSILRSCALPGRGDGHRPNQLELDLNKASVGPIFVLSKVKKL